MTVQPMQPDPSPAISARSLIHGQGHPSQVSRMRQRWRLETSGQAFLVRRAVPADLPAVMGAMVRSSALSRWQWRRTRGGGVPSMSEMAQWLRQPASLVVVAPSPTAGRARGPADRRASPGWTPSPVRAARPTTWPRPRCWLPTPGNASESAVPCSRTSAPPPGCLGAGELIASPLADGETAERMLASFGQLHHSLHPHGTHARVRLSSDAVTGLGPLRVARLG